MLIDLRLGLHKKDEKFIDFYDFRVRPTSKNFIDYRLSHAYAREKTLRKPGVYAAPGLFFEMDRRQMSFFRVFAAGQEV